MKRKSTKMENIFESLENLSEGCMEDIFNRILENLDTERKEKVLDAIQHARSGAQRTKAIKVLGKIQQRMNKQNTSKENVGGSGITFTSKSFS